MGKKKWRGPDSSAVHLTGKQSAFGVVLFIVLLFALASIAYADLDCVSCHGPNGPHGEGFSGCNICHGYPPVTSDLGVDGLVKIPSATGATSPGGHARHATITGYNFACGACHFNGMPVTLVAESPRKMQMGFDYLGTGGGIYDGRVLASPYSYEVGNGTVLTTNGSMSCSNIYCHSDGTSVSTGVIQPGASPSWNTPGPLVCNSCHAYPPLYAQDQPKSNSHLKHQQQLQYYQWFSCGTCHYSTTNDGGSIANPADHVNGQYTVTPGPGMSFTFTPLPGGGRCNNITCHPEANYHNGASRVWGDIVLQASISATPGSACYQVNFIGWAAGGTPPYTYFWEFGDDTTGEGIAVSHIYATNNTYYPRLTVTDSKFHSGNVTTHVVPAAANGLPVANKTIAPNGLTTVRLTDLSYDSDYNSCGHSGSGNIRITWGEGQITNQSINLTASPSNAVFDHTYVCPNTCTFNVSHTITDNSGGQVSSTTVQVTVPQRITLSGTVLPPAGFPFHFTSMRLYLAGTNTTYGSPVTTTYLTGAYSFTNVPAQCYDVRPVTTGYIYTPPQYQNICVSRSNLNFVTDH